MTEIQNHTHEQVAPVIVSEDNVAKVNVTVEEHELEVHKAQFIKEKAKNLTLQGFRKGKAPKELVARHFKFEAREAARDNVLYSKYMKLLQEHKLQPLSAPKVEHLHDEGGKICADIVVDVLQPVVLGQYMGLELETMPTRSVEDGVAKTLNGIKGSYPKLVHTENPVETGNVVIADFTVTDGAKELEKQVDFKMILGENKYFSPFEEQVIGMKAGETKEFDVNFPDTYHQEDFKNKTIHFNFTAKEIKIVEQYTDDELAKVLDYENEAKLKENIKNEVEAKYKDEERLFFENQLLGQLLTSHQFKIPRKLIDDEIKKIRAEKPGLSVEETEDTAERFVRTELILHAIYERHPEIHFNQEDFNAKIAELAVKANDSVENTLQRLQTAGKLQAYVSYLTNCKVIDFLVEMADKKELVITQEKDNG